MITAYQTRVLLHVHGGLARWVRWAWRCTHCGHRMTVNGVPPIATRDMPVRTWPLELLDRYRTKHR